MERKKVEEIMICFAQLCWVLDYVQRNLGYLSNSLPYLKQYSDKILDAVQYLEKINKFLQEVLKESK